MGAAEGVLMHAIERCRGCGHAKTIEEVEAQDLCFECSANIELAVLSVARVLAGDPPIGWRWVE